MSGSPSGRRRWPTSSGAWFCSSSSSARPGSWPASPITTSPFRRLHPMADPVAELRSAVEAAAGALRDGAEGGGSRPTLERPSKPEFGDYSTNAAMLLAPALGEQPRGTAEKLAAELDRALQGSLERVEVAGPGFLNLFLAADWYRRAAGELAAQGEALGRPVAPDGGTERVNVEFVSANPTGPVTPARRLRRLGRPPARVQRPPGNAGVLRERPRRPDRRLRQVDRRADDRRTAARGRLRGRVRRRAREGPPTGGTRRGGPRRAGAAGDLHHEGGD